MNNLHCGELIKFFEQTGIKYVNNIMSMVNIQRMENDPQYALKAFFFFWAFERQGSPLGYKVAAIKAISTRQQSNISSEFRNYYRGKVNEKNNPILDEKVENLDIVNIINLIKENKYSEAFEKIKLRGLGHKIRAFCLRDISYLLQKKPNIDTEEYEYFYLTPVDIWIRLVIDFMTIKEPLPQGIEEKCYQYNFPNKEDFITAWTLITLCKQYEVSPLLTNMGMWYFCSRYVGDAGRLKSLLETNSVEQLNAEVDAMASFADTKMMLEI